MIDGSMKKEYRRPDNQESQRQHDTQLQKKTSMHNNARHKDSGHELHTNKEKGQRV
jgi:hypothetical protein